jgi:hypothetical protein
MRLVHYCGAHLKYMLEAPAWNICDHWCGVRRWVSKERKERWKKQWDLQGMRGHYEEVWDEYSSMPVLEKGEITSDVSKVTCIMCIGLLAT